MNKKQIKRSKLYKEMQVSKCNKESRDNYQMELLMVNPGTKKLNRIPKLKDNDLHSTLKSSQALNPIEKILLIFDKTRNLRLIGKPLIT